jgi:hypothetical protein
MKRDELKQVLKPLIKQCIKEVIFEEGVLSGVISEVIKGTSGKQVIKEAKLMKKTNTTAHNKAKQKIVESKKKLLDAIGVDAYSGMNLFEGTDPIQESAPGNSLSGVSSKDAGVDITQIPGMENWKLLINK